MAYVSQELKAKLSPAIKAVLKQYGMKGSISVRDHSTLVVTLSEGMLDIIGNVNATLDNIYGTVQPIRGYIQVNTYHIESQYTGIVKEFLLALKEAMNVGNFDKSEPQSDYFHVGWYADINVGKWDKPYVCTLGKV